MFCCLSRKLDTGSIEHFLARSRIDLGSLTRVKVWHDGFIEIWYLEKIVIKPSWTNSEYVFNLYCIAISFIYFYSKLTLQIDLKSVSCHIDLVMDGKTHNAGLSGAKPKPRRLFSFLKFQLSQSLCNW